MPKKIFTQELEKARRRGRPRKGWREEVARDLQVLGVRRWRELVIDRKKMEKYCSTGQSPQRAVAPTEEEYVPIDTVLLPRTLESSTVLVTVREDTRLSVGNSSAFA